MASNDGGQATAPQETHVDPEHGLWIPPRYRVDGQVVVRTPRGTIQHYGGLPAYYGMVTARDFGPASKSEHANNPELAPNRVSLKIAGEDAHVLDVDLPDENGGGA